MELLNNGRGVLISATYRRAKLCLKNGRLESYIASWRKLTKRSAKTTVDSLSFVLFLSNLLYFRLMEYAEEILDQYQCSLRPDQSSRAKFICWGRPWKNHKSTASPYTIYLLTSNRRLTSNVTQHISLMKRWVPSKLVQLVAMATANSKSVVSVQNVLTELFDINTGVRLGDALSALVSKFTIECIVRELNIREL